MMPERGWSKIDALEMDQTFWWRGEHRACGNHVIGRPRDTHSRQVRCEVVERDRPHCRKVLAQWGVDVDRGLVSAAFASR
jgi:hypothetical protein